MADTAHKKIMDKIGARLALITVARGYFFDVKKVDQVRPTPLVPYDIPAIFYAQISDDVSRSTYGGELHTLTAAVYCYTTTDELTPPGARASEIGGALITALHRDTLSPLVSDALSRDLGEMVQELTAANFSYQIGEGQSPYLSVTLTLRIVYRAPIGDAFIVEN